MVQALKGLAVHILSQSDEKLADWKIVIQNAVDEIGQLLIDIVPEFEWIIGPQEPIPNLNVNQLENRINFLVLRLIQEIASPEHPLVLFIDDLQWADTSSWKSFENLLSGNTIGYFMVIFTNRFQKTDDTQNLSEKFNNLITLKGDSHKIVLGNLTSEEVLTFLNDSMVTNDPEALSQIIFNKTIGNPYFIHKFIITLQHQKIIKFIPELRKWVWDPDKISTVQMADNVIAYMNEKVKNLPINVLKTLMVASCVGNTSKVKMLCDLLKVSKEEVEKDLIYYVTENLLEKESYDEYRFVHDRIQQTSHELLPEEERNLFHYKIAGILIGDQNYTDDAKYMFMIARNYNIGNKYILPEERISVARLNYKVGLEAKKTSSFELAFKYLESGLLLLN
ncbi:AAA family ATPase, partial [Dolichospermum sp. ST_sed3]|nr:AAA family ATPase [Dolichospermum sp. ST_sed3]